MPKYITDDLKICSNEEDSNEKNYTAKTSYEENYSEE